MAKLNLEGVGGSEASFVFTLYVEWAAERVTGVLTIEKYESGSISNSLEATADEDSRVTTEWVLKVCSFGFVMAKELFSELTSTIGGSRPSR
jgi:hypothetical protein